MAGTNQFVPFGTNSGALVLSPATWAASNARQAGFSDGIADTASCNTAWRQPASMAAALGGFIADNGFDALDNGDINALKAAFRNALDGQYSPSLVHYAVDGSTSANSVVLSTISPALSSLSNGTVIVFVPANTNTANVTAQVTVAGAVQAVPVVNRSGINLASGDMLGGRPLFAIAYGGTLRILTALASELITTIVNSGQVVVPRDNPTVWVRPDGNDGNDGSVNDAGHAFQSIGAALRIATSRYAFSNLYLRLGIPGTYASPQYIPTTAGAINIIGDASAQGSYVIQGAGSAGQGSLQAASNVNLTGLTIVNTGTQSHTLVSTAGATVACNNVGLVASSGTGGFQAFGSAGRVVFASGCTIQGNAAAALWGEAGGEAAINPNTSLAIVGNPNFSVAFAVAVVQGRVTMLSGSTITGSATGARYNAQSYGIINTNGGGQNFFPGDQPGFVAPNSYALYQ